MTRKCHYNILQTNPRQRHAQIQSEAGEGGGGPDPVPLKNHSYYGFLEILVRIPWKVRNFQASIQYWAIIGPPAKRHLYGVSLVCR